MATKALNLVLVFILALSYFYQGILYGFQVNYLPLSFKSKGASTAESSFLRLLAFPWLLKGLWAPAVDKTLDTKTWISGSFVGTAVCLLICVTQGTGTLSVVFASALMILNVFSATAELGLSRCVITCHQQSEMWLGSVIQTVGYKSGALFGGGFLIWIQAHFNLDSWLVLGIPTGVNLIVITTLIAQNKMTFKETSATGKAANVDVAATYGQETEHNGIWNRTRSMLVSIISSVKRTPGTFWIILCVCSYKLGGQGGLFAFQMYLVDYGINVGVVGLLAGVAGQIISIIAAAMAGVLIQSGRLSDVAILQAGSVLSSVAILMQVLVVNGVVSDQWLLAYASVAIVLVQFVLGAMTTAIFTLMMTCSKMNPDDACASHYALLITMETGSKLLYIYLTGLQVDLIGYINTYHVLLSASAFFCFVMVLFPKSFTSSRKREEVNAEPV